MNDRENLLEIRHLGVDLGRPRVPVVADVDVSVARGEVVGVVGESGSGKSMTARSLMRLLPDGAHVRGSIVFDGSDVLTMSKRELAAFRSSRIGMIYQDSRSHINPLRTIGDFLTEGVVAAGMMSKREATQKAIDLLAEVGIPDGERRLRAYPHQLSGGLLQRVMIVMAVMTDPDMIIADEATTALDVTVQADVVGVFRHLQQQRALSMLFITHDLDLAALVSDTIVVMYAGRIVERGPARDVYTSPRHPYTAALLQSRPNPKSKATLVPIPGRPQAASEVGDGCVFATRCAFAQDRCRASQPGLEAAAGGAVACHRAEELIGTLTGAVA